MVQVFMDLETTGTWQNKHGIHEIAMLAYVDGKLDKTFHVHVRPIDGSEIDDEALVVCNVTEEQIMAYDAPGKVFKEMKDWLARYVDKYDKQDKMFLYGYNIKFDEGFLRQWFKKLGDPYFGSWFFSPSIDIMSLAMEQMKDERNKMPDFQLMTVASRLGIPIAHDQAHGALFDAEVAYEVYSKL